MKSFFGFLGKTILVTVFLLVALVLTVPFWLGPVMKPALKAIVPKLTKTSFDIRSFDLNPYTGCFALGGVVLGNPNGYSEPNAFSIGSFEVDVDVLSLSRPTVVVEKVILDDIFISYITGGESGEDNFSRISANVAESLEKSDVAEPAPRENEDLSSWPRFKFELPDIAGRNSAPESENVESVETSERAETRVVVNELIIRDIRGKLGPIPFMLPAITIHDIGKETDGVTFEELGMIVWTAIVSGAGQITEEIKDLSKTAIDIGTETAAKTVESLKKIDVEGAANALESAKDQLIEAKDQLKNAGDQLKDAGKILESFLR